MPKKIDLNGQILGRLTVLHEGARDKHGRSTWHCRCTCGTERRISIASLMRGTKSCGCLQKEATSRMSKKHGLTSTPEYRTWDHIKTRCLNPNFNDYHNYGGRGITICDRWLNSFENFLADMGERPTPKHSIERNDTNGNYEPSNCSWATHKEQCNNQRRTIKISYNGKIQSLKNWSRELCISYDRIRKRYKANLTPEEIFEPPTL